MAITSIQSSARPSDNNEKKDVGGGRRRRFDAVVPAPERPLHERPTEEHTIEVRADSLPNTIIRVALQINPGHVAEQAAIPTLARSQAIESTRDMQTDELKPFTPRAAELVLSEVDHFLSQHRNWGEISLLKAGKLDHRLIARIRAGESFRTGTVDQLYDAMNKARRGELKPDEFRNTRAAKPAGSGSRASNPKKPKGTSNDRSSRAASRR